MKKSYANAIVAIFNVFPEACGIIYNLPVDNKGNVNDVIAADNIAREVDCMEARLEDWLACNFIEPADVDEIADFMAMWEDLYTDCFYPDGQGFQAIPLASLKNNIAAMIVRIIAETVPDEVE